MKVKKRINYIVLTQNRNIKWIIGDYIKLNTVQKFDKTINEPYLLTLMNYRLCKIETNTDLLIDALHPYMKIMPRMMIIIYKYIKKKF